VHVPAVIILQHELDVVERVLLVLERHRRPRGKENGRPGGAWHVQRPEGSSGGRPKPNSAGKKNRPGAGTPSPGLAQWPWVWEGGGEGRALHAAGPGRSPGRGSGTWRTRRSSSGAARGTPA